MQVSTVRETILAALHAQFLTLPATALRGDVLPELVLANGLLALRDGKPGEPEVTMSPLRYHCRHLAEIEAVVQGTERDAAFDALCASIGSTIAPDQTLGGLCDWVEAEAPRPADLPVDGAVSLKAAVIPVILHYSTLDPLICPPIHGASIARERGTWALTTLTLYVNAARGSHTAAVLCQNDGLNRASDG